MIDINTFIEICDSLKLNDKVADLEYIKSRLDQPNKEIFIPIVGEFSSGKTSLINALTDSKKLGTASKATTATIFEVRFGCDHCHAEVIDANNHINAIDNLADLKNDSLVDAKLVRVYDTSKQVPATTILVDTPGLSSNDPRHKIALTSYLPQSDAILLAIDINQQVTRSLIDFVNTTKISNKPIYLVITKSDTKSTNELEAVKNYIQENIKLPLENIVVVSAVQNSLDELYRLFSQIQFDKNTIVSKALESRVNSIARNVADYVDELIKSSSSSSGLNEQIDEQQRKLQKIGDNIDKLIKDASHKIEERNEEYIQKFKDAVSTRLDVIVQNQGQDCDQEVYSAVNTLANLNLSNYKKDIQSALVNLARERQRTLDAVPLQSLETLEMSDLTFNPFTYNLNLSELGHKNDKMIGGIVKVGLAVAAVASVAVAAGAFAGGGAVAAGSAAEGGATVGSAVEGGTAISGSALASGADLAVDAYQMNKLNKLDKASQYMRAVRDQIPKIEELNQRGACYTPQQKGVIETGVSWITEKCMGKPQRRRAVSNYLEGTLLPEFENQMDNQRSELIRRISNLIHEEAQTTFSQMETALSNLKDKRENENTAFEAEMKKLRDYKSFLK